MSLYNWVQNDVATNIVGFLMKFSVQIILFKLISLCKTGVREWKTASNQNC